MLPTRHLSLVVAAVAASLSGCATRHLSGTQALARTDPVQAARTDALLAGLQPSYDVTLARPEWMGSPRGADALLVGGAEGGAPAAGAPGGEAGGGGADDLAKKLSNPVASLISVPFFSDWTFKQGPEEETQYSLTTKPVVPIKLSCDVTLIQRAIWSMYIDQAPLAPGLGHESGWGDLTLQSFFSPTKPGKLIWGVGPVFLLPTADVDSLGLKTWGVGPAAVALTQTGHWTVGMLATQTWGVAKEDKSRPDLNVTFLQPFVTYAIDGGWTVSLQTETTYDWTADQWTVPVGLFVGKVLKLGKLPVQITAGPRYYADAPEGNGDWGARLVFTFLFPAGG